MNFSFFTKSETAKSGTTTNSSFENNQLATSGISDYGLIFAVIISFGLAMILKRA